MLFTGRLRQQATCECLGEEEGAAQVYLQAAVEAVDADLQQIAARQHRHSGVVDQAIQAGETLLNLIEQFLVFLQAGDIGSDA
ncbi:hypothetical protein D3C78_1529210 [compost metagenome]